MRLRCARAGQDIKVLQRGMNEIKGKIHMTISTLTTSQVSQVQLGLRLYRKLQLVIPLRILDILCLVESNTKTRSDPALPSEMSCRSILRMPVVLPAMHGAAANLIDREVSRRPCFFRKMVGSLFVGYVGGLVQTPKCDEPSC